MSALFTFKKTVGIVEGKECGTVRLCQCMLPGGVLVEGPWCVACLMST